MLFPVPLAIFTSLALLFLLLSGRARGLKSILVASYCGIIIISFTGGASGGIWLGPLFLYLVGLWVIWRPQNYAFGSKRMSRFTYILLWVYVVGVVVGLLRYDPSVEIAKAGAYKTLFGIPIQLLMATYRFYTIAFLFLAFALPLRYYIDRELLVKFLVICWISGIVFASLTILDFLRIGNFDFTAYQFLGPYTPRGAGILGFYRGAGGMMMVMNLFMSFAMTQLTRNRILKGLGYASLPLLIMGLLFTFSRTAVVGMLIGGVSLAVTLGGARAIKGIVIALIGAIAIFTVLSYVPEVRERFALILVFEEAGQRSFEELSVARVTGWAILIKWVFTRFDVLLFGAGFHNFLYYVTIQAEVGHLIAGHNNYLHVLIENGIFGLIIFLGWIISIFCWLVSWRRMMTDKVDKTMPGIFMSLMVAVLAFCMFSESLSPAYSITPFTVHFYLILGIWTSYYRTQMMELYGVWEPEHYDTEGELEDYSY